MLDKVKQKFTVNSIHRAASILDCLINNKNTVTDIANYCKLSKSTVHRLLKALEESDFVLQDPVKRRYYLGYLFTRLASNLQITHDRLITCAIEEMKYLSDIAEETDIQLEQIMSNTRAQAAHLICLAELLP